MVEKSTSKRSKIYLFRTIAISKRNPSYLQDFVRLFMGFIFGIEDLPQIFIGFIQIVNENMIFTTKKSPFFVKFAKV